MSDKNNGRLILVTGGGGFIGSHIVAGLLERGDAVRVLDNFSTGKERTSKSWAARAGKSIGTSSSLKGTFGILQQWIRRAQVLKESSIRPRWEVFPAPWKIRPPLSLSTLTEL